MSNSNSNEAGPVHPDVAAVWERFSNSFNSVHTWIFAEGDTTGTFKENDRTTYYSHDTRDIINNVELRPCTDACQHGSDWPEDASCLVTRPDGLLEILPPTKDGPRGEVEVCAPDATSPPASERGIWPQPTEVCDDCSKYAFSILYRGVIASKEDQVEWGDFYLALAAVETSDSSGQPFHRNFPGLQESSRSCAACRVFLSALPDPDSFNSDDSRPIVLRVRSKDDGFERSLSSFDVGFPAIDSRHPDRRVTRYGKVDVIAAHGE